MSVWSGGPWLCFGIMWHFTSLPLVYKSSYVDPWQKSFVPFGYFATASVNCPTDPSENKFSSMCLRTTSFDEIALLTNRHAHFFTFPSLFCRAHWRSVYSERSPNIFVQFSVLDEMDLRWQDVRARQPFKHRAQPKGTTAMKWNDEARRKK